MPENDRLDGCLNDIELGSVEREATPRLPMKLGYSTQCVSDERQRSQRRDRAGERDVEIREQDYEYRARHAADRTD